MKPEQLLLPQPLKIRVDEEVMTMIGYSTFPKAPAFRASDGLMSYLGQWRENLTPAEPTGLWRDP